MTFTQSRRQQLIVKHTLISASLLSVASAVWFVARPRVQPYTPGEDVKGITRELDRALPSGYPAIQFTNVAQQAGIGFQHFQAKRSSQLPEDMGSGAAWGDYDGDGYPDLYVADIAAPLTATPEELAASLGGNRLYHNNRDGTFTDVTVAAGVGYKGLCNGAAWADFDNDGRPDLVATCYDHVVLYHNRGDGTFEDVSHQAGLDKYHGFWTGASWADYDRDGYADLYVCGYVKYHYDAQLAGKSSRQFTEMVPYMLNPSSFQPERNLLFHNNGDGTFTEVAKQAGVDDSTGRSLSAAWADFDGDGWPDLYVANDISENKLYLNLHNGRFKDVSNQAWVNEYRGSMGLAVGDWDRDGDLDIFITHWIAQQYALFSNLRFNRGITAKPGRLRFQDVADMEGLGQMTLGDIGWGTSFFDYDNDGQLDLFTANGSTFEDEKDPSHLRPMKNFLFWQKNPDEGFFEVGAVSGAAFQEEHVGRGAAFADYMNNGRVGIFVVNYQDRPLLLLNDGGSKNSWLKVRLHCTKSNRSGFGAKVEIESQGEKQFQEIGSQPSYLSQNSLDAHFGLGHATEVDRLTVRFPSGIVREMRNVPANQTVTVDE
ncbi:MAG TPA: CRTAC1 family protein [Terriglobia bacterium]|nr:CRTAC1 family protein [Terriglobia bacterium]